MEGIELESKISSLNFIFPAFENQHYVSIASAFEIDEIIYYYPGIPTVPRTYTNVIREWYCTPFNFMYDVIITEPYEETLSQLKI